MKNLNIILNVIQKLNCIAIILAATNIILSSKYLYFGITYFILDIIYQAIRHEGVFYKY
jgi:hypothetical protein